MAAFWAWAEGRFRPDALEQLRHVAPGQREILGPLTIYRRKIPELYEEYMPMLAVWSDYKTFGLPYAGGYMQQPAAWVKIVRAVEAEQAVWQEQQIGRSRRTQNHSKGRSK